MPKYYDFMICGYYLYFTSHCIVEAMHVHASDRHLTESGSAKLFVMGSKIEIIPTYHKVVIFRHRLAPLIFCFVSNTFERC